jgi:hypothetical protein
MLLSSGTLTGYGYGGTTGAVPRSYGIDVFFKYL